MDIEREPWKRIGSKDKLNVDDIHRSLELWFVSKGTWAEGGTRSSQHAHAQTFIDWTRTNLFGLSYSLSSSC